MTLSDTEWKRAIKKTAILIHEDKKDKEQVSCISKKTTPSKEDTDFLQKCILRKKLNQKEISTDIKKLLECPFLRNGTTQELTDLEKNSDLSIDIIINYFIDLTNRETIYRATKNSRINLAEIAAMESALLQSYTFNSDKFRQNDIKEIKETFQQKTQKFDDLIFGLINTLYSKLIFGREDIRQFQENAPAGQGFFYANRAGCISNIAELSEKYALIPEAELTEHIKKENFSKWIRDTFGDDDLANKIKTAKTGKEIAQTVREHAKYMQDFILESEQTDMGMEIAAEIFLRNFINQDLLTLIPFLVSKEEVKLLKLVDIYVEQNKTDQDKKELLDFLLNPKAAVKKIQETYGTDIGIGFDFVELFQNLMEMHDSGTLSMAEEVMKHASAEFLPMELNAKAKELFAEFNGFMHCYENILPKPAEKVSLANRTLNEKVGAFNQLILTEQRNYRTLCSELNAIGEEFNKSVNKEDTFANIMAVNKCRSALEKFMQQPRIDDETLIPELKEFRAKKEDLYSRIKKASEPIRQKFGRHSTSITNKIKTLRSKNKKTLTDIEELEESEKTWNDIFQLAYVFYGEEDATILKLPEEIARIKEEYHAAKNASIARINDINGFLRSIPTIMTSFMAGRIEQSDFSTIKGHLEQIKEDKKEIKKYRHDTKALGSILAEFDSLHKTAEETMESVKSSAKQKLDIWLSEISSQIDNASEFSQYSYETWPAVCSRIEKLTSLAEIVGYEKKKLTAVAEKADEKKAKIEQTLQERIDVLAELDKKIDAENKENEAEAVTCYLGNTGLINIINRISGWKSEIVKNAEWENDIELKAQIEKITQKVSAKEASTKKAITNSISDYCKDIKNAGRMLSKPEKKTILSQREHILKQKKYLENLSAGEFAAKTSDGIKEAQALIEKAAKMYADYIKDLDSEITPIETTVSKDYDLSTDKKILETSLAKIDALIKDAKDLKHAPAEQKLNETKAAASGKIAKIDEIVQGRRTALNRLIEEHKKQFSKFVNARKESITDSEIIDASDELIKSMFDALQKQARCKDDTELAPLHAQADNEIWNYFADAVKHMESRIDSLDAFVKEKEKFAEKEALTITELKALVKIPTELEEYKKKYCAFDRTEVKNKEYLLFDVQGIKTNTIAAKLKHTDSVISKAQGRIKAITEDLTAKFNGIESFAKGKFEYTQEILGLTSKKTELQKLNEFIIAMGLNLLVKKVSNSIDEQIKSILTKSSAKQKVLERIIQNTKEKQDRIGKLLKEDDLTHSALLESYAQLGPLKKEISEKISESYCNDDALKEICAGISSDAAGLQDSIEKRILQEVEKLDSKIKGNIVFIDSAKLTSLQNLRAVMEAERNILSAQEKYKDIEEYAKPVLEKHKCKSAILEQKSKAQKKIDVLTQKLAEKISSIDTQTKKEFEYSQEIKSLDSWKKELNDAIPYITELKSDLPAEALISRINEKIDDIQKKVAQKSTVLKEVDAFIIDKQDKINALIAGNSLDDKMIEQSYALWTYICKEITDKITKAYEKDDALNPECKSIKQNKGKILNFIDARILQEAKQLDETVINKFNFINDTDIDSPEILSKILEADKSLMAAQDSYRKIKKYIDPVLKNKSVAHRTLEWKSPLGKVNAFKDKLQNKFFEIKEHLQNDFEYSQEMKRLVEMKDSLKEMSPYLQLFKSDLPIDDALEKTKAHALQIMKKRREKKQVLAEINEDISNKKQLIRQSIAPAQIFEDRIDEKIIMQYQSMLDKIDKDITTKITNTYIQDISLMQKCEDIRRNAHLLWADFETIKILELKTTKGVISEKLQTIQKTEITSPKDIPRILETEQELLEAQAYGSMIMKYLPAQAYQDMSISALVSQKSMAEEKISALKTALSNEFSEIEKAVSNNFEYTQEIQGLNTHKKRLDVMCKYFAELGILEAPAALAIERISQHTAGIRQKLRQKKEIFAEINKTIAENKAGLKEIVSQKNLAEEALAQGKEFVDSAETKIRVINETYEKEQRLKQKCENARKEVRDLRRTFENRIVKEIEKFNSCIDADEAAINSITEIDKRRKLKTIQKADSRIEDIKKKYEIVKGYAANIKDAPIKNEIISPAPKKIMALIDSLDKNMVELEKIIKNEYKFSQDADFLQKENRKIKRIGCLYALLDNTKFENAKLLCNAFKEKITVLNAVYNSNQKLLQALHIDACGYNEQMEALWQNILEKDNLTEAAGLIKTLDDKIRKSKSMFGDKKLSEEFSQNIYAAQKELKEYYSGQIRKTAEKYQKELDTSLNNINSSKTGTAEGLKFLKDEEKKISNTNSILLRFKPHVQTELDACFKTAENARHAVEAKYCAARSSIDSEYNLLKIDLHAKNYKFTQQSQDLKNKKDNIKKNTELCEIIDYAKKADFEELIKSIDLFEKNIKDNYEKWKKSTAEISNKISNADDNVKNILIADLTGDRLQKSIDIFKNAKIEAGNISEPRQDKGLSREVEHIDNQIAQLEKQIDDKVNAELAKFDNAFNERRQEIETINPQTKDEQIKMWGKAGLFNDLQAKYEDLRKDKYAGRIENKLKEIQEIFEKIESKNKRYTDEYERRKQEISKNQKDLAAMLQGLEPELQLAEYACKLESFGKKLQATIDSHSDWARDDAIEEYRTEIEDKKFIAKQIKKSAEHYANALSRAEKNISEIMDVVIKPWDDKAQWSTKQEIDILTDYFKRKKGERTAIKQLIKYKNSTDSALLQKNLKAFVNDDCKSEQYFQNTVFGYSDIAQAEKIISEYGKRLCMTASIIRNYKKWARQTEENISDVMRVTEKFDTLSKAYMQILPAIPDDEKLKEIKDMYSEFKTIEETAKKFKPHETDKGLVNEIISLENKVKQAKDSFKTSIQNYVKKLVQKTARLETQIKNKSAGITGIYHKTVGRKKLNEEKSEYETYSKYIAELGKIEAKL